MRLFLRVGCTVPAADPLLKPGNRRSGTHSSAALGSRDLTVAQLDNLSLNSLPDLSCSLCHPPPVSPSKIHLAEKLAAGVEGIQAERRWRLMALAPSPGRGRVRERPGLIKAKGHCFPFRPLHVSPAPHQRNTQPGHFVSRSAPRHPGAGVPGVVTCSSFCSRRQGNPEDLPLPQPSHPRPQLCFHPTSDLAVHFLSSSRPRQPPVPASTPFPRPLNLYLPSPTPGSLQTRPCVLASHTHTSRAVTKFLL